MITVAKAIPDFWTSLLTSEQVGLGLDLATTDKGTSNPSSLTVGQRVAGYFIARLVIAWKTADPQVTRAVLKHVLDQLAAVSMRPRRLSIDASNETFFATELKQEFGGRIPTELIKGGEVLEFRGQKLNSKTLLGNLYASLLEDGLAKLPADDFIALDYRLVKREAGGFVTETGKGGEHGDCFDSGKLSYWSLVGAGGPVKAEAMALGELSAGGDDRPGIKNPWLRRKREAAQGFTA